MAMARVSVEVPAGLVGRIRETVLLLYEATAESLHLALRARSERRGSPRELHEHRLRLAQLDGLLTQLGPPAGSRHVSAPAELLHDALYGALIDARAPRGHGVQLVARRAPAGARAGGGGRGACAPPAPAPAGVPHMTAGIS